MSSEDLTRGLLYLSLTVVGVPGNAAVVLALLLLLHRRRRLLPPDAILLHLACSNLLVVGVRCLLVTVASFGAEGIFGDASCKAVVFTYRTFRAFSIWLTLVLSAYQCLSVAPPGSRWLSVRAAAARYLGLVFLFLWVFNICMSLESILFCVAKHNDSSQIGNGYNLQFCYLLFPSKLSKDVNTGAQVTRDAVPMALMTVTSVIILLFLYKNSQRVKGLRGGGTGTGGGGGAAEQRAAKSVVALVTLYVVFYGVDSGLTVYMLTVRRTMSSSLVTDLRVFFSTLYAAVSPLLIIASNRKVSGSLRCAAHRKWAQESPPRA
ncbi:olfactory receptor class A-like protein 1 [Betta splendens]|uniref:Vomeronasal type-1 receptor n=1 Tax=Betta splendens TaxID=158456 RepID=A0A6P7MIP9_BETSP|nr:olfactory receptor class A-like protein 1 [Betta splendens]